MTDTITSGPLAPASSGQPTSVLEFDRARYESEIGNLDLTDAQRTELLTTLWSIMQNMVELGYSVTDLDICGSIFGEFRVEANREADGIESSPKGDGAEVVHGKAGDDAK